MIGEVLVIGHLYSKTGGTIGFSLRLPGEIGEPEKTAEDGGRGDPLPPCIKAIQQLFSC